MRTQHFELTYYLADTPILLSCEYCTEEGVILVETLGRDAKGNQVLFEPENLLIQKNGKIIPLKDDMQDFAERNGDYVGVDYTRDEERYYRNNLI